MVGPERSQPIRLWRSQVEELFGADDELRRGIALIGEKPFDGKEFSGILRDLGIERLPTSDACGIVVVGRDAWLDESERVERELIDAIRLRMGRTIRIYSQELLLWYLSSQIDPYVLGVTWLLKLSRGHPVLEWLSRNPVDIGGHDWRWPAPPMVSPGGGAHGDVTRLDIGMLQTMGYQVGKSSPLSVAMRHHVLERICNGQLRFVDSVEYMDSWGEPRTSRRLGRLAWTIARLRDGEFNNPRGDYSVAVRERQEDLDWPFETFYRTRGFSFQWPGPAVGSEST